MGPILASVILFCIAVIVLTYILFVATVTFLGLNFTTSHLSQPLLIGYAVILVLLSPGVFSGIFGAYYVIILPRTASLVDRYVKDFYLTFSVITIIDVIKIILSFTWKKHSLESCINGSKSTHDVIQDCYDAIDFNIQAGLIIFGAQEVILVCLGIYARYCAKRIIQEYNDKNDVKTKRYDLETQMDFSSTVQSGILGQENNMNPQLNAFPYTNNSTQVTSPSRPEPVLNNIRVGSRNNANDLELQDNTNIRVQNTSTSDQQYVASLRYTYQTPKPNVMSTPFPLLTSTQMTPEANSQRDRIQPAMISQSTRSRRVPPSATNFVDQSQLRRFQQPSSSQQQQGPWNPVSQQNYSQNQYNDQDIRTYRRSKSQPQLRPQPLPSFGNYTEIPPVPAIPKVVQQPPRDRTTWNNSLRQTSSLPNIYEVSSSERFTEGAPAVPQIPPNLLRNNQLQPVLESNYNGAQSARYEISIGQYNRDISSVRQSFSSEYNVPLVIKIKSRQSRPITGANQTYNNMLPPSQSRGSSNNLILNGPDQWMADNGTMVTPNSNYSQRRYEQKTPKSKQYY
ncbi:14655_t:CDS:2 [Acaulospora morrowiae]|uniref:14655_t:CDS:1 n=1 Tax=Acaulospora morrowiae TaxID=94023 RepID=A0A9N9DIF5_9GLOM|nr:14655_t:CDS:2 [Acaulospora morrowiae]